MGAPLHYLVLALVYLLHQADGKKTYADMFPHKHSLRIPKLPFPIGWDPASIPGKIPFPIGWDPASIPGKIPFPIGWDPASIPGKIPFPIGWNPVSIPAKIPFPIPKIPFPHPKFPFPIPKIPFPIPGLDPGNNPAKFSSQTLEKSSLPIPELPFPIPGWDPASIPGWDPDKNTAKLPIQQLEKSPIPDIPEIPYPIPGWDPASIPGWDPDKNPAKLSSQKLEKSPIPDIPEIPYPIPGWDPASIPGWDPDKNTAKLPIQQLEKSPIPDIPEIPYPIPGWDPASIPGWDPDKNPTKLSSQKLEKSPIPDIPEIPYPIPGWDPASIPGWDPDKNTAKLPIQQLEKSPIPDIPEIPYPIPGWDPASIPGWDPDKNPVKVSSQKLEKSPIPEIPYPIPGWDPDTNPWDEYLYPPFGPKPKESNNHKPKTVTVRLTSDSPAINGSSVSFTARLEVPPCHKVDDNGNLVHDEPCEDANGQVRSGAPSSWMDDYGFGKCTDLKTCDVFPDGKPFPQSNDWGRKGYVYVWHTMGQYHETTDGTSSSLTLNTSGFQLGTEVMEVMVYRKRERRKYVPLATDNHIYFITDTIPLAVNVSQKAAANLSDNVYYRGYDVLLDTELHDPSGYLKTASALDFMWDFGDGNRLVTHNNLATHTFRSRGDTRLSLMVRAAFETACPPPPPPTTPHPPTSRQTSPPTEIPETTATTSKMATTQAATSTTAKATSAPSVATTTSFPPFPDPTDSIPPPDSAALLQGDEPSSPAAQKCYRYVYGYFGGNISVIDPPADLNSMWLSSHILAVSVARETDTDISFHVKCLGSIPTLACTVVSDATCTAVSGIVCDEVPPSPTCEVHLRRHFALPGTFCINITLGNDASTALATTSVTISYAQEDHASTTSPNTTKVVVTVSALLAAALAFIAFLVYRRYKADQNMGHTGSHLGRLRRAFFPINEENRHLLTDRHPL